MFAFGGTSNVRLAFGTLAGNEPVATAIGDDVGVEIAGAVGVNLPVAIFVGVGVCVLVLVATLTVLPETGTRVAGVEVDTGVGESSANFVTVPATIVAVSVPLTRALVCKLA